MPPSQAAVMARLGCRTEPLRFCPDQTVTRSRMATFLVRAFDCPSAADQPDGQCKIGWFAVEGDTARTSVPDGTYTAVSAGWGLACAIDARGEVVCWS